MKNGIKRVASTIMIMLVILTMLIPTTVFAASSPMVKYFGGLNREAFKSFDQTRDGGYVAVGTTSSNDDGLKDLNKGHEDALIVKYSANGDVEWVKTFGGSLIDEFNNVRQTKDGGYIAVGDSSSIDKDMEKSNKKAREGYQDIPNVDAIIVKFSSTGDIEWLNDFGGKGLDRYNSVVETDDGKFFVVGESDSSDGDMSDMAKGYSDAIYAIYNHDGAFMGVHNFGGSSSEGFNSVVKGSDGSFVAVGYSSSRDGDMLGTGTSLFKGIIVKIGEHLNRPWMKAVDLTDPEYKRVGYLSSNGFQDVKNTTDNGFIVAGRGIYIVNKSDGSGNINEEARIYKFDTNGNEQWQEAYRNLDYTRFYGVAQGKDGTYTAVGSSHSPGPEKIIAVGYDANGNRLWAKEADRENYSGQFTSLQVKDNEYVVAGFRYTQERYNDSLLYIGNFEESSEKLIMTSVGYKKPTQ